MEHAIRTRQLSKSIGGRTIVDRLDLEVPRGCVYGFLGPNGAGKTTTMRLLLGLLPADEGSVAILGHDLASDRLPALRRVGSFIEGPATYDHLTGRQALDLARRLLRLPVAEIDRVLEIVDLTDAARRRIGTYSAGMRQRLALARALLGQPELLLLDEPTNGLDPDGIADARNLIRSLPKALGCTVFVSSHLLGEVELMAGHIGLIHNGQLLCQGPLAKLLGHGRKLRLQTSDPGRAAGILTAADWLIDTVDGGVIFAAAPSGRQADAAIGQANRRLVEAGIDVTHLSQHQPSLEDLYRDALHHQSRQSSGEYA